jgi:hypothetical protein
VGHKFLSTAAAARDRRKKNRFYSNFNRIDHMLTVFNQLCLSIFLHRSVKHGPVSPDGLVVRDLNHPLLMTPVQSQAETVFSFSEILFHM